MHITYESPTRLVIEHRPVAMTGIVLCAFLGVLLFSINTLSRADGSLTPGLLVGGLGMIVTAGLALLLLRVMERVKISFRRKSGTISIIHKTLFTVEVHKYPLGDLQDIEPLAGRQHPHFTCLGLRLKNQPILVPLHPRCLPHTDPSQLAQRVRNWVPIN